MSPTANAILDSWSLDPWLAGTLAMVAVVYLRGWRGLRTPGFGAWRVVAFLAGLGILFTAVASPLDAFADLLLQVHMTQHLLLMLVAPPLLLLGWPAIPMLRGLPPTVRRAWLGPFLASPGLRKAFRRLTHPVVCWGVFVACFWAWHVPALYEAALTSRGWHAFEHACFVFAGLLFWWPVVRPHPFTPHWPRWAMIPYLLAASLQNTVFSAIFTFGERVFYPVYETAPRLVGMTALQDQAAAGAIMWVPGSILMLVPAAIIAHGIVSPRRPPVAVMPRHAARSARLARPFDLLRVPVVGPLLARRSFRTLVRALMLLAAAAIVLDGLLGPRMAAMNLAGVLPWTHWRGLAVIALLIGGNFFCMACPFMLPRSIGRRFLAVDRPWPRWLRSKWLAVGLVTTYLVAYEVFDLWASPWWTAWIVVGYFVAAFAIDGIFRGASFCKYACPIGQFHFVQSMVSPLEVKVRDHDVCASCRTHDCVRGNATTAGCGTHLFQPRKVGNFDCTFCMDCVSACPHANVGIAVGVPGRDLVDDRRRSSIGLPARRLDIAALITVLVFGAFANAAGMVAPFSRWQESPVATAALLVAAVLVAPGLLVALAGAASRGGGSSWRENVGRFVPTLIPIGFAMWFSHMFFHLVTGAGAIVPVVQRVAGVAEPAWGMAHSMTTPAWLVPAELAVLGIGVVTSVAAAWLVAAKTAGRPATLFRLSAPWAVLSLALYAAGIWLIFQPMEMRGTMMP